MDLLLLSGVVSVYGRPRRLRSHWLKSLDKGIWRVLLSVSWLAGVSG